MCIEKKTKQNNIVFKQRGVSQCSTMSPHLLAVNIYDPTEVINF